MQPGFRRHLYKRTQGIDLDAESENGEHADTLSKLRMGKPRHPIEPLFEGDRH